MKRDDGSDILISPGIEALALERHGKRSRRHGRLRLRANAVLLGSVLAFLAVGGQLLRLASLGQSVEQASVSRPLATAYSRPDIVDRNGRLIATDVVMPSLYADPLRVLDVGEVAEKLPRILPDLKRDEIRQLLSDRSKQFVWLKRGISPTAARAIHHLGLPGLAFQQELKRAYPSGALAGHVIGFVNVDNLGLEGIERFLDDRDLTTPVHAPTLSRHAPLALSLDISVQHALSHTLLDAIRRYKAEAAAGVVLSVETGEIFAAASLPSVDPLEPLQFREQNRVDRLMSGTYELGSVFKLFTVALALDRAKVTRDTKVDVTRPLLADGHIIEDPHPSARPLTVTEIFTKSSNVGAGLLATVVGTHEQRAFLERAGLSGSLALEPDKTSVPRWPQRQGAIETVTMSYGYGIAVSPLQFAAAVVPLVNGGRQVKPTFMTGAGMADADAPRLVSEKTSAALRQMMRDNVASRSGTGWRADVPGLRVGGKTGTAEIAVNGTYDEKSMISSFVAAFPMDDPKFLTLVTLFKPQPVAETGGKMSAGRNAAPTTARLISRIAPLLGIDSEVRG